MTTRCRYISGAVHTRRSRRGSFESENACPVMDARGDLIAGRALHLLEGKQVRELRAAIAALLQANVVIHADVG